MSKKYITEENFKNAEKTASERDLHISEAVGAYIGECGDIELLDVDKAVGLIRPRPANSHKGSFGKLVIVAGSDRFPGAAQFATLAALRSGVGTVTVITTPRAADAIAFNAKEATLLTMPSDERGFILPNSELKEEAAETVSKADALLIGPGLGTAPGSLDILKTAIKNAECPIILDADGINLVCGRIELLRKAKSGLILTPHPTELSRLCGAPLDDILRDRLRFAKSVAEKFGCVIVSKSSGTLIASGDGVYLSCRGNNGLSKGGSGDFLAGLIASFAAQGCSLEHAAIIGVTVQGLACETVTKNASCRSVLPSDMINCLPMLFKKIERLI